MIRKFTVAALGLAFLSAPALAEGMERLGYGRLVTNDVFGDGQDRWRTGSVASSRVWGRGWDGALPSQAGDLLEFRIGAEIIAPDNLVTPAAGDRPFAGAWSFGLHTHYQKQTVEIAMGVDLVLTGPMTHLDDLQTGLHNLLGVPDASTTTLGSQIANGAYPTAVVELGRDYQLGDAASLRPFVEARAGVETLVRAGMDLTLGKIGRGELLVRDPVTGQRYRTIQQDHEGFSFVLGADIAKVTDSAFLPSSAGYGLTDSRQRVRAGLHWQGETSSVFYGMTWLGEEFTGQTEGQLVGSLRLNLDF